MWRLRFWKDSVSFGLPSIPIRFFSAARSERATTTRAAGRDRGMRRRLAS